MKILVRNRGFAIILFVFFSFITVKYISLAKISKKQREVYLNAEEKIKEKELERELVLEKKEIYQSDYYIEEEARKLGYVRADEIIFVDSE